MLQLFFLLDQCQIDLKCIFKFWNILFSWYLYLILGEIKHCLFQVGYDNLDVFSYSTWMSVMDIFRFFKSRERLRIGFHNLADNYHFNMLSWNKRTINEDIVLPRQYILRIFLRRWKQPKIVSHKLKQICFLVSIKLSYVPLFKFVQLL